jgi:uncharacterized protein (TIGR00251 family)
VSGAATTIDVRLKPRSSRCATKVRGKRSVEISVTSPPVDNRANEQLIEFLADVLGVGKSSLSIIKGGHSRNKVVEVAGLTEVDVESIFERIAG